MILRGALRFLRIWAPSSSSFGLAELRQVAAVEDEVGLRIEVVHVVDRAQQRPHEAVVDVLLVEVRVGDVGEAEGLGLA